MNGICFSCGKTLSFSSSEISRREECSSCRSDVHVCKNCSFYDSSSYNECRESQAEVVREKDRANFCDYFQLNDKNQKEGSSKVDLKAQAEALFKNWGKK